MRKILFVLFCLVTQLGYAQVVADSGVIKTFNDVIRQLRPEYRQQLSDKINGKDLIRGYVVFTILDVDTLNKKDKIANDNKIKIVSLDSNNILGKSTKHQIFKNNKNEDIYIPKPYIVGLMDTVLELEYGSFSPNAIFKIINGKAIGTYSEYNKQGAIMRLSLSQTKRNYLVIPVKDPKIKLNTLNLQPGNVVYGEVEFTTDAYYVDDYNFTSKYIKKRMHCKFVFKAIVRIKGESKVN